MLHNFKVINLLFSNSIEIKAPTKHLLLSCLFSCAFEGTREQLAEHLEQCKFEGLKGFLSRTDDLIRDLQEELKRKDDDITFLRSMLASLSEKVDQYEKNTADKIGELKLHSSTTLNVVL